jgi:hypothetical protein
MSINLTSDPKVLPFLACCRPRWFDLIRPLFPKNIGWPQIQMVELFFLSKLERPQCMLGNHEKNASGKLVLDSPCMGLVVPFWAYENGPLSQFHPMDINTHIPLTFEIRNDSEFWQGQLL